MAVISFRDATYNLGLLAGDGSGFGLRNHEIVSTSTVAGTAQVRAVGLPLYTFKLDLPRQMDQFRAGQWRGILMSLRGGVNRLEAYDPAHQFPAGTARGDRTLGASAAKGAPSVSVTGSGTVLPGDWLQIGTTLGASQLVMVTAAATLPATVQITPPVFFAFGAGARVRVDRPCTFFRMAGKMPEFGGVGGTTNLYGASVEFVESLT
jgi:hypothetical protein